MAVYSKGEVIKVEIVKTTQLIKVFKGAEAVNEVNLSIKEGEIYGFLGPNGAGKTTTIRMLIGLMKPTSGEIELFGERIKNHRQHIQALKKIGSLVESPSYYAHLTARENLEVLRKILGVSKNRVDEVLNIVKLTKEANRPVKGFSLGMKQRLGIASALLGNPRLLILDEPTNGLDPAGIQEIRSLIKEMPGENGVTVLISSHLLYEIDHLATQVGIITKGKMLFNGSIESLRKKAKHQVAFTTGEIEKTKTILLANGFVPTIDKHSLLLDYIDHEQVAHLVYQLVQENVSIYRVEEKSKSLEDIFLKLTSEENEHVHKNTAG